MCTESCTINSKSFSTIVNGRILGLLKLIPIWFLCAFGASAQSSPSVTLSATNLTYATPNSLSTVKAQLVTLTNTGTGVKFVADRVTEGQDWAEDRKST